MACINQDTKTKQNNNNNSNNNNNNKTTTTTTTTIDRRKKQIPCGLYTLMWCVKDEASVEFTWLVTNSPACCFIVCIVVAIQFSIVLSVVILNWGVNKNFLYKRSRPQSVSDDGTYCCVSKADRTVN